MFSSGSSEVLVLSPHNRAKWGFMLVQLVNNYQKNGFAAGERDKLCEVIQFFFRNGQIGNKDREVKWGGKSIKNRGRWRGGKVYFHKSTNVIVKLNQS